MVPSVTRRAPLAPGAGPHGPSSEPKLSQGGQRKLPQGPIPIGSGRAKRHLRIRARSATRQIAVIPGDGVWNTRGDGEAGASGWMCTDFAGGDLAGRPCQPGRQVRDPTGAGAGVRGRSRSKRRGGAGGDREHVGNRDAAGQPGESDGGVRPGQTRGIAERPPADVWRRRMCTGSPRDGYGLVQSPTATVDSRSAASIDASGARRRLRRASAYCAILLNI
jgi:hypothetical protein